MFQGIFLNTVKLFDFIGLTMMIASSERYHLNRKISSLGLLIGTRLPPGHWLLEQDGRLSRRGCVVVIFSASQHLYPQNL
jgi:hypothetical protein